MVVGSVWSFHLLSRSFLLDRSFGVSNSAMISCALVLCGEVYGGALVSKERQRLGRQLSDIGVEKKRGLGIKCQGSSPLSITQS